MEYPFKDLLPLDEATARDGYYKDWTHIDANTFHQISELAKFIREKGHGADTREAMAQALERVYHDATQSGNANMEVSMARRGYSTLAESLGNLSVNMINKNLGKLDQTFMTDEFLQQMAGNTSINAVPADGTVTTEKLADRSVTWDKTNFVTTGKNLFDKNKLILGKSVNSYSASGAIIDQEGFGYVEYFPIKPDTQYHPSHNATVAFYEADKTFIESFPSGTGTILSPPKARLARLSIWADNADAFQFEEGTAETSYESFKIEVPNLRLEHNPTVFNATIIAQSDANQFVVDLPSQEIRVVAFGGRIISNNASHYIEAGTYSFENTSFSSIYLAIDLMTRELIFLDTNSASSLDTARYGVFGSIRKDQNSIFLNGTGVKIIGNREGEPSFNAFLSSQSSGFVLDFEKQEVRTRKIASSFFVNGNRIGFEDGVHSFSDIPVNNILILVGVNTKEIYFVPTSEFNYLPKSTYGIIGVMRKEEETFFINGTTVDVIHSRKYDDGRFNLLGDDMTDYVANDTYIDMTDVTDINVIYDRYDSLVAEYPNYVTRSLRGTSSGGKPIYMYEFKEPKVENWQYSQKIPKILYFSSIHGHENLATFGGTAFFEDLCRNWKNQTSLRFLKSNVHFFVIPILNPDGFNRNVRTNGNHVDLARNFPAGWGTNDNDNTIDPNGWGYYRGPSPASEVETQVVLDVLSENEDMFFAFDHHNSPAIETSNQLTWIGSGRRDILKLVGGFGQTWTLKIKQTYPVLEQYNFNFVDPIWYDKGGTTTEFFQSNGYNGVILETAVGMGTTEADMQVVTTDIVGNMFLSVLRGREYIQLNQTMR